MTIKDYIYGLAEFFIVLPIFLLNNKLGIITVVALSAIINSYTDIKERYVDDQFIIPPILFAFLFSYIHGCLVRFTIFFSIVSLIAFLLYIIGAWSSGDVTSIMSITPIFLVTGMTKYYLKVYAVIFSIIFFTTFIAIAVKRHGIKVLQVDLKRLMTYSIFSPFYAVLLYQIGQYKTIVPLLILFILFLLPFFSRRAYYILSVIGIGVWLYYRTPSIITLLWVFIGAITAVYIFLVSKNVRAAYVRKVFVGELKEGDVIGEMVVGEPPLLVEAKLKNIIEAKQNKLKVILSPTAEGLSKDEIKYLQEKFPSAKVTVKETVFIAPFIYLSAILLIVYYFLV